MVRLTVDGSPLKVAENALLVDALSAAGKAVPHMCHDKRLVPSDTCHLCLMGVEGQRRQVASYTAGAVKGAVVQARSHALDTLCRTNLELITTCYPRTAYTADLKHPFHRLLAEYGVPPGDKREGGFFKNDSHPYLSIGMECCVHCDRCVRICKEVQGQFIWETIGHDDTMRITADKGSTSLATGCVSCGACVDGCASGTLFDKWSGIRPTAWTRTTCAYCTIGYQMGVRTAGGHIVLMRPTDSPISRGHLYLKGRHAFECNHTPNHVTQLMLRHNGRWQAVGQNKTLGFATSRLQNIVVINGADAIDVLGSSRAANERNHLAQKFARVALCTHNIDCCARVCHAPSARALKTMLGIGTAANIFDDIEHASTFLICGANPTENHLVVGARIRQAVLRGARLVAIDPCRTELAALADVHLPVRAGSNVLLFNMLAAMIIEEGWVDRTFLFKRIIGFDTFVVRVAHYTPESVAERCGTSAPAIRAAAGIYAKGRPAMCFHDLGVTKHLQGSEAAMALINLAPPTGNLDRPGSDTNPLRGQSNVQGTAQMECDPATLTGAQSIGQASARFEQVWGAKLPAMHGLGVVEMMDAAQAGRLKTLWVTGYDIYLSLANASATAAAFDALDPIIVQGLPISQTAAAFDTMFLPAASAFEEEGTFMNSGRRVQRVHAVTTAPGQTHSDWWTIQALTARMSRPEGFEFDGPKQIWNEVRALWPEDAGLAYSRLDGENLHWPCPDGTHTGTPALHRERFSGGRTAALIPVAYMPTPKRPDDDYPFLLTTGRVLEHFNAGTVSYRIPNAALRLSDTLNMAPADAARRGFIEGDTVKVTSRYGSAVLPLHISHAMQIGQLFCSFHRTGLLVSRLTSPVRDRLVHTPEYRVTAVRVKKRSD